MDAPFVKYMMRACTQISMPLLNVQTQGCYGQLSLVWRENQTHCIAILNVSSKMCDTMS